MIRFSPEQIHSLEKVHRIRRREQLWNKLKTAYPVLTDGMENQSGIDTIDKCIDDGKGLEITQDDDLLRFSILAFLPKDVRHNDWFSSIVIRVLHNESLSAEERLSFIYVHVIEKRYLH